jgi:glutaredoxin
MNHKLILYSRQDCCLCDEMKAVIRAAALKVPLDLEEIDTDASTELREKFGDEAPVLFIDGRKAFKYRVTERELAKCLRKNHGRRFSLLGFSAKGRRV